MIRTATPEDLAGLTELFSRANDAPYPLAAVAAEKCFGDGAGGNPVMTVHEDRGRLLGAAVSCGRYLRLLAVDRVSRRQGIGAALLREAESRGVEVIGAEPGNYFTPGVLESDEGTIAFFTTLSYAQTRSTWNLDADLSGITPLPGPRRAAGTDAERVLAFIENEFGRIWRFEAERAFDSDPPAIFITEEEGAVTGFAVHDVNNRGLGFFGPMGVAPPMRGRGLGCRLALASLADLRQMGHERAVIPWTDALAFYRKCCGATPAHRFVTFEKERR